jgi:hypothetical protein
MSANRKNLLAGENNFQKVKSFFAFASTIYAYFLNFGALGGPGMGKSAISAHLAHFSKLNAVAYHFCRWDEPATRDARALVANLSFQLAARIPSYRSRLKGAVLNLTAVKALGKYSMEELFTQLLSEPLRGIDGGQGSDRLLLIIDGLDEAPEIAELLGKRISELPQWLAIVATSRPDPRVLSSLGWSETHPRLQGRDERNVSDLDAYIDSWFSSLVAPVPNGAKAQLLARSEGSIYYLVLAREAHLQKVFDLAQPDNYPKGLSSLYRQWFARQFQAPGAWDCAAPLLRLLCASPAPMPQKIAANILGWKNEDKRRALAPLGALIRHANDTIEFSHRSFSEWLQDFDMAAEYWINPADARVELATTLWQQLPDLIDAAEVQYGHLVLPTLMLQTEAKSRSEVWGTGQQHLARLGELAQCLEKIATYEVAQARVSLAELRLQACIASVGAESQEALLARLNWASLQRDVMYKYEIAKSLGVESLKGFQRLFGSDHVQTLNAMAELAITHRATGNLEEAQHLQEDMVAIGTRLLGAEDLHTLSAMVDLASTYRERGSLSAARTLQETVLESSKRLMGAEDPNTVSAMNNLANTVYEQGDYQTARELQQKVVAMRSRILGEEHLETLSSLNNLSITLYSGGAYSDALALQEKVLATRTRVLGPDHPDTLVSMSNLATTLKALGEISNAGALQEKVLATRARILGPDHPDTLASMSNLASTLNSLGDLAAARDLNEKVLASRTRILGPDHPDTLASMSNLASTLYAQDDINGARNLSEQVLSVSTRVLGETHPQTLTVMANLAAELYVQGDFAGAHALQENVLANRARTLGLNHMDTLSIMLNLALTLKSERDFDGACELENFVVSRYAEILGSEHPQTLSAMNTLVATMTTLGKHAGAFELIEKMFIASRRYKGPEHADTLALQGRMAINLYAQKNYAAARDIFSQLLLIRQRTLGADHADTVMVARLVQAMDGELAAGSP